MIIPSRRLNFIHVPKASGSSVFKALHLNENKTADDKEFQERFSSYADGVGCRFPNHLAASRRLDFLGQSEYRRYFSFAFVRNPFDRLVSLYEYTHQTEKEIFEKKNWKFSSFQENILSNDFKTWVENYSIGGSQCDYLLSEEGGLLVDYIGRTERFDEDISRLAKALGFEPLEASVQVNSTVRPHYRDYFDASSRSVVEKKCADDIKMFGYEF